MASSIALKKFLTSNLLSKTLRSTARPAIPASQFASRSFNTNAARDFDDSDDNERSLDVDRRSDRSAFRRRGFAPNSFYVKVLFRIPNHVYDVFDPFSSTRSLSQMMDQFMDSPFAAPASRGLGEGLRRGWDAKETDDGLHLRIDMPGLDKEHVKVTVEQNTLIIKGESEKEAGEEEASRKFIGRMDLLEKIYKTDEIKAVMKNGVLKVVVPKTKVDERCDVFQVKID